MVDTVEQTNIRGLDIDKAVKGFALIDYVFKSDCNVSPCIADSVRWYQETSADLTATAPSVVANISPLSQFPILEVSWTRNTSYVRKYAAEGFLSMEDVRSADIDVLARTLLRLTRAVVKQVDARIFAVESVNYASTLATALTAGATINALKTAAPWNIASQTGVDIVQDLLGMQKMVLDAGYSVKGAVLYLNSLDYKQMVTWLISTKGASIPQFSSAHVESGSVMEIMGLQVKVSPNVTASGALLVIPGQSCTWKQFTDTTATTIADPGIGTKVRVWEVGEAILTDPLSVCLLYGTQT